MSDAFLATLQDTAATTAPTKRPVEIIELDDGEAAETVYTVSAAKKPRVESDAEAFDRAMETLTAWVGSEAFDWMEANERLRDLHDLLVRVVALDGYHPNSLRNMDGSMLLDVALDVIANHPQTPLRGEMMAMADQVPKWQRMFDRQEDFIIYYEWVAQLSSLGKPQIEESACQSLNEMLTQLSGTVAIPSYDPIRCRGLELVPTCADWIRLALESLDEESYAIAKPQLDAWYQEKIVDANAKDNEARMGHIMGVIRQHAKNPRKLVVITTPRTMYLIERTDDEFADKVWVRQVSSEITVRGPPNDDTRIMSRATGEWVPMNQIDGLWTVCHTRGVRACRQYKSDVKSKSWAMADFRDPYLVDAELFCRGKVYVLDKYWMK